MISCNHLLVSLFQDTSRRSALNVEKLYTSFAIVGLILSGVFVLNLATCARNGDKLFLAFQTHAQQLAAFHTARTWGSRLLSSNSRFGLRSVSASCACGAVHCIRTTCEELAASVDASKVPRRPLRKFVAWPFGYQEQLDVRIDKLTNLGMGVARVPLSSECLALRSGGDTVKRLDGKVHGGELSGGTLWVVFVPSCIPGEFVRVRVVRNTKTYSEAELVAVLEPSKHRVAPRCAVFGECGGCQYQHMTLAHQHEWKRQQVADLLERLGGVMLPLGLRIEVPLSSGHEYGYRSKISLHYDKTSRDSRDAIGFRDTSGRALVDVHVCHIASPTINAELAAARAKLRDRIARGRGGKSDTLLLRDGGVEGVVQDHLEIVTEHVCGVCFRFHAGDFFQNNPHALPIMVEYVVNQATAPTAAGTRNRFLIDAYCGGGLFALNAAKCVERCFGVEISAGNVRSAKSNARLNEINNCEFLQADASAIFGTIPPEVVATETVVVIDPPRRGCDEAFLRQLLRFAPARIVYVSCDPATQARDARVLLADGDYEIKRVQPVDLFPQTRHIENVITFDRQYREVPL